jgi:phage tail sheath gpL-like
MATLVLTVKTSNDVSLFKQASQDRENLNRLINLLSGVNIGAVQATVDVQSSTSDPVAATASIALTYANIDADDTVTICNTVLTAKASGANGTTQFNKQTNATTTAANLVTCINANTTLNKLVVATSSSGTVTLTARQKGVCGNGFALTTSDATAFGLTAFASGAGGATDTAVSIAR